MERPRGLRVCAKYPGGRIESEPSELYQPTIHRIRPPCERPARYRRQVDPETIARHAEMLANRVRKNHRKLRKAFEREGIGAYRLYDRDIPEVRAVVDRYEDHLVVGEFAREQTADAPDYVEQLARAAGEALGLPEKNLHVRRRQTRPKTGSRYNRRGEGGARIEVRERGLRFWVNLDDYLDTGLFSDHRETRRMFGELSSGARVLNLFAYTGTFTCWAAYGGARRTVSVDASSSYLDRARDNLELNSLAGPAHELVASDVHRYLASAPAESFDLAIVDPPSFSTRYGEGDFDVLRDHPDLLRSVARLVVSGGRVIFSTNRWGFEPRLEGLPFSGVTEITAQTVPRDYRNREVHRAFTLER